MHINVIEYLINTASQYPNKIACIDSNRSIIFKDLTKDSINIASNLSKDNNADSIIYFSPQVYAIFLPKNIESILAFFGVLFS
ncbi:MAG: hypothetical protein K2P17_04865, partial [Helicobacteraceae bacterium]|nr:hypothetical protein [Helicobacteraceae bacterium]